MNGGPGHRLAEQEARRLKTQMLRDELKTQGIDRHSAEIVAETMIKFSKPKATAR